MSSADIIPATVMPPMSMPPWSIAAVAWCRPSSIGAPQSASHWVIIGISGSWAALIWAASALTSGEVALVAARSAISMACWWWGIISWANAMSASLPVV